MQELSRNFKLVTVWLLIGLGLFLAATGWLAHQQRSQFSSSGGAIELKRASDGHFHWPGRVNGVAVDFLVDTGATSTALPLALAQRARLATEGQMRSDTAGGVVRGQIARADVTLDGGVRANNLRVTVLPNLSAPLLGMDILSKMRFTQHDGVLRFEPSTGAAN